MKIVKIDKRRAKIEADKIARLMKQRAIGHKVILAAYQAYEENHITDILEASLRSAGVPFYTAHTFEQHCAAQGF